MSRGKAGKRRSSNRLIRTPSAAWLRGTAARCHAVCSGTRRTAASTRASSSSSSTVPSGLYGSPSQPPCNQMTPRWVRRRYPVSTSSPAQLCSEVLTYHIGRPLPASPRCPSVRSGSSAPATGGSAAAPLPTSAERRRSRSTSSPAPISSSRRPPKLFGSPIATG